MFLIGAFAITVFSFALGSVFLILALIFRKSKPARWILGSFALGLFSIPVLFGLFIYVGQNSTQKKYCGTYVLKEADSTKITLTLRNDNTFTLVAHHCQDLHQEGKWEYGVGDISHFIDLYPTKGGLMQPTITEQKIIFSETTSIGDCSFMNVELIKEE